MNSSQSPTAAHNSTCCICGKSVQNSSIKRHERYCRKRLVYPSPSRRKSCIACIRAKRRCDSLLPTCSTCQRNRKDCVYSSDTVSSSGHVSSTIGLNQLPETSMTKARSLREVPEGDTLRSGMFITFDISPKDTRLEKASTLPLVPIDSNFEGSGGSETASSKSDTTSNIPSTSPPILLRPINPKPVKVELVSKLVSQIICSFPERRMDEDSFPPFIHHSTFQRLTESARLEDPIAICQQITRKFAARKASGDLTVWEDIASEQERIYDQRDSYDKWWHLSSAQATTMYLLMLASEDEIVLTHHSEISVTLLFTLGSIFKHLNTHANSKCTRKGGEIPTWSDWIFAESKLRTAMVYFILALHFNVNFGLPCDREGDYTFEDLDLPAAKKLWEAKNEEFWCKEFGLEERAKVSISPARADKTPLKYGDLVRFNKEQCAKQYAVQDDNSGYSARIERWQRGVDEFGMLVALCSTMV